MRALLGKLVYKIFGRIIWHIELHGSRRARVIVVAEKTCILLTRSMIGEQKWELPGGGVNDGEDVLDAAVREVDEETKILLNREELKEIASSKLVRNGATFTSHFVLSELKDKKQVKLEWPWLLEAAWFGAGDLPEDMEPADRAIIKQVVV